MNIERTYKDKYYNRFKELINETTLIYTRCPYCNNIIELTDLLKNNIDGFLKGYLSGFVSKCDSCKNDVSISFIHFNRNNLTYNGADISTLELEDYFNCKIYYK